MVMLVVIFAMIVPLELQVLEIDVYAFALEDRSRTTVELPSSSPLHMASFSAETTLQAMYLPESTSAMHLM
jgi:hypothetical protein